jgi:hypothetical protein
MGEPNEPWRPRSPVENADLEAILSSVGLTSEGAFTPDDVEWWVVTEPGLLRGWYRGHPMEAGVLPTIDTELRAWRDVRDPELTTRVTGTENFDDPDRFSVEARLLVQSPRLDVTVASLDQLAFLLVFARALMERYNRSG